MRISRDLEQKTMVHSSEVLLLAIPLVLPIKQHIRLSITAADVW